ncbi:biogenesis of lysosome-related organelles complex 1 subunit 1 [Aspergillus udagawae]|nr:biogenesis of lysosome-related organelles complex 1 subunit 1 [Aspergillus udagawae]
MSTQPPPPPPPPQQSSPTSSPTPSQRTLEAKAAFTASLRSAGANYDAELRDRARTLHENAAALDKQEAELRRTTAELGRQNEQWEKVAETAREGLKEIGDVQNWAELIERDLLVVEEMLKEVEAREEGVGQEPEEGRMMMDGKGKGKDKGEEGKGGWLRWW